MSDKELGQVCDWQTANYLKPPKLDESEVHLWCLPLQLEADQTKFAMSLLSDIQRDKYHRRSKPILQQAYLASRFYLLNLLAAYSGSSADAIQLSYSRLNKPYLNPNPQQIEFNFTDTKLIERGNTPHRLDRPSLGLFAFSNNTAVGVDIECLNRRANFPEIADKRFTRDEIDFVYNQQGEIIPERFLACWTRKEAFGKATGKGINFRMNAMNLSSPNSHDLNFHDVEPPHSPYRLHQLQLSEDFIACLVHGGHQSLAIKTFSSQSF